MNTLVFFDIDGTLLSSGGAGSIALDLAAQHVYGVDILHKVPVHGRTDTAIVKDLLHQNGLDDSEPTKCEFLNQYIDHLPSTMQKTNGKLLPGIEQLLASLSNFENLWLGILTGNIERAAKIKLEHFGIDHYFTEDQRSFGGYGDFHANRDQVAKAALEDAYEKLEIEAGSGSAVVIGDTIHDIRCAKAIGAKSIAVLTGGVDHRELLAESPDVVLDSCADIDFAVQQIISP